MFPKVKHEFRMHAILSKASPRNHCINFQCPNPIHKSRGIEKKLSNFKDPEINKNVENLVFYQKRRNNSNIVFVTRYVVIKGVKSV